MLIAMMRKSAMLLLAVFGVTAFALAQNQTVTGVVTDKKGEPLPGVTITIKGTQTATSTNSQGVYTLNNVPTNAVLVLTGVGVSQKEEIVNGRASINIDVETSVGNLNEVVVVGYGTARRKDLTGAVSTVQAKDFNKGTYTSADQLIQGKVAGVLMINNTGQPGGASTVKIRGNSTVTGSGQPLYVVDGVPLDGRSARPGLGDVGFGGSNPGANPLNFMNPADIASIDVLKDASATAIYGSRGAYGVILITTKKGQTGQPKIDISASIGQSKIANKLKVLDAEQYRKAIPYYGVNASNDFGGNVDALDAILQTGLVQNYNLGISGGNENAKFRISLGALDQEGIVVKTGIKKFTANINANFKFLEKKNLGLDINVIPSQYIEDLAPISNNAGSRGNLIGNALQWNPTRPLVIRNSTNTGDSLNFPRNGDLFNPLAVSQAVNDQSKVTTVLASISPYIKLGKSWEYRFLYSINYGTGTRRTSIGNDINIPAVLGRGQALLSSNELTTQQFTHTLTFNQKIASKLNLNAVAGFEYLKYTNKGFALSGVGVLGQGGFGNYGLDYTNYVQYTDPSNRSISSFADPSYEIQSYFARAVFNYADRFLITGTLRSDGSSKFGTENKYGYFPSFSAAWNINKESFFSLDFFNSLKLRGGWGKTGNQEFPSGSAQSRYNFGSDGKALVISNNANDSLKWQSDRQYNIGLDAAILNNKVNVTVDYFNKKTTDLLFPTIPLAPAAPGGAITWKNIDGVIVNRGVEVAINSTIISKKDFTWDFGINATFIKNEVSELKGSIATGALNGQGSSGATVEVLMNGLPINAFYTRKYEGLDKNGIAIYPNGDRPSYIGSPNPSTLVGVSTTLSYKKLTLTLNANGAFGHYIYNETLNNVVNVGSFLNGKNIALSVYENPVKESFANPVTSSSRFIEKADYFKLTNATISYGIGNIGKTFKNANVFITGQNLLVLTDYTGFDPEVNVDKNVNGVPSVGIEYIPYPSSRTITLGVNVSL